MRSALWAAPAFLLIFTGCPDEAQWDSEPETARTTASEHFQTTRKAGAPPAIVHASVELSELAATRFLALVLMVQVYSGESLDGQGLRAQWLGEPGGEPVRASFGGAWSTEWSTNMYVWSNPCAAAPCVLDLELAPEGEWSGELSFDMEYDVIALLELQPTDYTLLDGAMQLTLEARP
jgi:hypothetical protein